MHFTASSGFEDPSFHNQLVQREQAVADFSLRLDGNSLTIQGVFRFLQAKHPRVEVAEELPEVEASSAQSQKWLQCGKPIYGLMRGLGSLKDHVLRPVFWIFSVQV